MADKVIDHPTYLEHIRAFFEPEDIAHMGELGIDLSTYEGVRGRASSIYFRTEPPSATMPPDPARRWSEERSQTFANWIRDGYPLGVPSPGVGGQALETAKRIRRDARALDQDDIELLAQAFRGLMERDPEDAASYFVLAGTHWYPVPSECLHHVSKFNPWHRIYVTRFEDALRSVPGCESVTLPYWDITDRPPEFLFAAPFQSYELPRDIHADYRAGYVTSRFSADEIASKVIADGIERTINIAMSQSTWERFITYEGEGIENAHDSGHVAVGVTMAQPDAAAFDPIFWFFHANWDRLWWEWQEAVNATTLSTFRSTITGSPRFLEAGFNDLPPFGETADQTIDLGAMDVAYEPSMSRASEDLPAFDRLHAGSLRARDVLRVHEGPEASVRLKGINRLAIPGSFRAILRADGEEIGRRTFFQSAAPVECATCRERGEVNLDFLVNADQLRGKQLSTSIELVVPDAAVGSTIPLAACGDPTLNVRLLVERR